MTSDHPFITSLEDEARQREHEESEFRRTMNARVAALAEARAFANRRMNLMRSLFATVGQSEQEELAIVGAIAALRIRLGWREDSDARDQVLAEYAKVAAAAFAATRRRDEGRAVQPVSTEYATSDVRAALAAFEAWYEAARGKPFWVLFEHYMPETQLVDF